MVIVLHNVPIMTTNHVKTGLEPSSEASCLLNIHQTMDKSLHNIRAMSHSVSPLENHQDVYMYFIQNKSVPHTIKSPPPQRTNGPPVGAPHNLRTSVLFRWAPDSKGPIKSSTCWNTRISVYSSPLDFSYECRVRREVAATSPTDAYGV